MLWECTKAKIFQDATSGRNRLIENNRCFSKDNFFYFILYRGEKKPQTLYYKLWSYLRMFTLVLK